jgi:hypothetical protein
MKVVGYSDRLSGAAGETIQFMVSCQLPTYRADIVRLLHGDPNPHGPGFKEEFMPRLPTELRCGVSSLIFSVPWFPRGQERRRGVSYDTYRSG